MKTIRLFFATLLAANFALGQNITLQKAPADNTLTSTSRVLVVPTGGSITATGTGTIIATGGTATTVPWSGVTGTPTTLAGYGITSPLLPTVGGTGQSTWTLGDFLYANGTNTLSKLAGNTSATLAVLTQTGTGTVSAAPVWTSTTGTGNVVRATSPTLVTPTIDTITASTSTALTLTGGSTGASLVLGATTSGVATFNRNQLITQAAPAFTTFWKTTGANTAKAFVGQLGSPEANISFNMDYATGIHKYGSDSTKSAVWTGMSGDYAIQFAPSGVSNPLPTDDIWNISGNRYLYHITSGATSTAYRMVLNTNLAEIVSAGYDSTLTVPRPSGKPSIGGLTELILEGAKGVASGGPIYLNHYGSGNVFAASGGGNFGVGTTNPVLKLDVARSGMNGAGLAAVASFTSDGKTAGDGLALWFTQKDSADNAQVYAQIRSEIVSPTSGSEKGALAIATVRNGTSTEAARLTDLGNLLIGTTTDAASLAGGLVINGSGAGAAASSTTTGALRVTGGVGVSGAIYANSVYGSLLSAGDGTTTSGILGANSQSNISNLFLARSDLSWGINAESDLRFYVKAGRTTAPGTGGLSLMQLAAGSATAATASVNISSTKSASSSISGAFTVGDGAAATNVAIGGGSMIAGANVQAIGNINVGVVGSDFAAGRINIVAGSDTVPALSFGGSAYGFGILEKTDGDLYFARRQGSTTNTTWMSVSRATGAAAFAGPVTINTTSGLRVVGAGTQLATFESSVNGAVAELITKGKNSVGTARQANIGINRFADDVLSFSNGTTESLRLHLTTQAATFAGNLTVSGGSIVNGSSTSVYYLGTPSNNYIYYDGSSLFTRLGGTDRLTINASTGAATFAGSVSIANTTPSTGVGSGALQVAGGGYFGGATWIGSSGTATPLSVDFSTAATAGYARFGPSPSANLNRALIIAPVRILNGFGDMLVGRNLVPVPSADEMKTLESTGYNGLIFRGGSGATEFVGAGTSTAGAAITPTVLFSLNNTTAAATFTGAVSTLNGNITMTRTGADATLTLNGGAASYAIANFNPNASTTNNFAILAETGGVVYFQQNNGAATKMKFDPGVNGGITFATGTGGITSTGTGTSTFAGAVTAAGLISTSGSFASGRAFSGTTPSGSSVGLRLLQTSIADWQIENTATTGALTFAQSTVPYFTLTTTAATFAGDVALSTAGKTISVKSGTNAAAGTVTLVAGNGTITSTAIDANTVIVMSIKTKSGSFDHAPSVVVSAGSAAIDGHNADASTYNWIALKVN